MRKIALIMVIVLLVSVFAAGCSREIQKEQSAQGGGVQGGHFPGVQPLSPAVKVTVGMKQVVSDAGILIGMAKGYYKELGIEIEPVQFNTGQDMINALGAGQLDVGCTVTASGLFNAMLRGIPIKIVADKGINVPGRGYYRLVIRKDLVDEIKDYKDLKGRKLAVVGTASLDEIALDRVLNKAGLTTRDVDLQVIRSFPDIVAAMSNKSIDGGMLIEPFIAAAVEKNIADPWKDPSEYDPDAQTALLVYGKSMIERPEVAKRFMLAYIKSLRDYNDAFFKNINKDEIVSILAEYSVVKDRALYDKMFPVGLNPDGYVKMKGIRMDLDWYSKRGLLKGELKAEDVVDNSYVDYALSVLGKYE
ncbi:ABC transporter substrate-binding protein [Thermosediminibacter oceani]|uniref:Extracellular solute-binding protein family 3 n=1 Tax=Thermosediminibacter oceani (strain ATCC BAA-1034 / DSM 16646 / JW/IW-1228P) TaxID=555079 RepID=D9RYC9_THEOJ|nr:ABC transporter substrate-binding protein [Thermosediminibacter oceani]ADL08353.1 extracellular solute-binding protein family 3 [Thermosediminibacter oceani DSM 16646]